MFESELRKKELDGQISSSIAEASRLKESIKTLESTLTARKSEVENEISELEKSVANKKSEVISIENITAAKALEMGKVQDKVNEKKAEYDIEAGLVVEKMNKKEDIDSEIEKAKESLQRVRERNFLEEDEKLSELQAQKESLTATVIEKKEELVIAERNLSKINFITDTAEKAAQAVSVRNSELEKNEKDLRNKLTACKTSVEALEIEELELKARVKVAEVKVKSDEARQVVAEGKREVAEAELEVAHKTLLSSIARFDTMGEQLNSRADRLKVAYDKAGIPWPNL